MRVNLSFELRSINITLKTCKLGWKHISENAHIHKLIASSFDLCIAQNGSVSYKQYDFNSKSSAEFAVIGDGE